MDSPPTSPRLAHRSEAGDAVAGPQEWTRGLVELDVSPDLFDQAELTCNGQLLPLFMRKLEGQLRVLADWPLSGAGHYELRLTCGPWEETMQCTVQPRKLTGTEVAVMVEDLQARLPATIAIALQRAGAFAGIELIDPGESTLAEELQRLGRAVRGDDKRPGLARVLTTLGNRPYEVLHPYDEWVGRERARRVDPVRLAQSFARPGNLDADRLPVMVPERRVEHTVDVYENRLVKAFYDQVQLRLRRVMGVLETDSGLWVEAADQLATLTRGRRAATFLDRVHELTEPPARITMVLLKRADYRAALEGFLEFRRRVLVRLDEPAIHAPLENLPFLYQTWGLLEVVATVLDLAARAGFRVHHHELVDRVAGELWVRLLPTGGPAVVLAHPDTRRTIRLFSQRSYMPTGHPLRSVSFRQTPDVAIEISEPGRPIRVIIFDPKYKLQSEDTEGQLEFGRPKKVDIDAMHAYRDAIRDEHGAHAVDVAAILYPGPTTTYGQGLRAIQARPTQPAELRRQLTDVLEPPLSRAADRDLLPA